VWYLLYFHMMGAAVFCIAQAIALTLSVALIRRANGVSSRWPYRLALASGWATALIQPRYNGCDLMSSKLTLLMMVPLSTAVEGIRGGLVWTVILVSGLLVIYAGLICQVDSSSNTVLLFTTESSTMIVVALILFYITMTFIVREKLSQRSQQEVAAISHELRGPLHCVQGVVDELIECIDQGKDIQLSEVTELKRCTSSMMTHLNNVLAIARTKKRKVEHKAFSLYNDVVAPLLRDMKMMYPKALLLVEIDEDIAIGTGDCGRIMEVLQNYVRNAVNASPEGAPLMLHISLKHDYLPREQNKQWLYFSVVDSGAGVPFDVAPNLFTAFMQTEASPQGGTGLGLYICKELASSMGGHVGFEPRHPHGSEFWIAIPYEGSLLSIPTASPRAVVAPKLRQHIHVLVVDDSPLSRKITVRMVQRALGDDVMIQTAVDGLDAVDWCTKSHYDVVLMDWLMPRMNGLQAAIAIRQKLGSKAPIIVAATGREEHVSSEHNGIFDQFLMKPFDQKALLDVFQSIFPQ
jgi:signal transduction histidine kinase